MTYTICEPCIDVKDKTCVDEWAVDRIYEGPQMLYIQPGERKQFTPGGAAQVGPAAVEHPVVAAWPTI